MVTSEAFRRDLATALLRCAGRRRRSRADGTLTGEDIKVVALLERLADDVRTFDLDAIPACDLSTVQRWLARRPSRCGEDVLANLGVSSCPSDAGDLVRWLAALAVADDRPRSPPEPPVSPGAPTRPPSVRRPASGDTPGAEKRGLLHAWASDFSAGLGIVAPLLSLWHLREAFGQLHDRALAADHAATAATVISVDATVGRAGRTGSDVVLMFRPSSDTSCRVTWHAGAAFAGAAGDTLAVVPRTTACALPLIPSQIGDPMQSFAVAAALMAGGLASLKVWAWLFRHPPRPLPRPVPSVTRARSHDLA